MTCFISYPFLFLFSLSLFESFLLFFLPRGLNFLSTFLLSESHGSSTTWLLDWLSRCRSCFFGRSDFEFFNSWLGLVELISFEGFRLWFWKVGWLGLCYCHLWLLSSKRIFELSLHRLKHFSSLHFSDLWLESVLFTKVLWRKLSLSVLVLLHTARHAGLCVAHLCLLVNAFFARLLFLGHFLIVYEYRTGLRNGIRLEIRAAAFHV